MKQWMTNRPRMTNKSRMTVNVMKRQDCSCFDLLNVSTGIRLWRSVCASEHSHHRICAGSHQQHCFLSQIVGTQFGTLRSVVFENVKKLTVSRIVPCVLADDSAPGVEPTLANTSERNCNVYCMGCLGWHDLWCPSFHG